MNHTRPLPASVKGALPDLSQLDPESFEKLCVDLFGEEPLIGTSEPNGERGHRQDGIDIIACRQDGDGIEVGQCKRYQKLTKANIQEAANHFLDCLQGRWASSTIHRFVLFVACDVVQPAIHKEIEQQRNLFLQKGMTFEVWSRRTICNKLGSHRNLVARYFHPPAYWCEELCGHLSANPFSSSQGVRPVEFIFESAVGDRLDGIRQGLREGKRQKARRDLEQLTSTDTWQSMSAELQAKALRLKAALLIDSDALDEAEAVANNAHALCANPADHRIAALILLRRKTAVAEALLCLSSSADVDGRNLRAALQLSDGRVSEAAATLDELDRLGIQNGETHRLRGLLLLSQRRVAEARLSTLRSLELEPASEIGLFTRAAIDFYSALVPSAIPVMIPAWPVPEPWNYIKRDDEALACLTRAADTFRRLAENQEIERGRKREFEAWALAALGNHAQRQAEAVAYCQDLLAKDPGHIPAVFWSVIRGFGIAVQASISALSIGVENESDIDCIQALALCYLQNDSSKKAIRLLDRKKQRFIDTASLHTWAAWKAEALRQGGDIAGAKAVLDEASAGAPSLAQSVRWAALRVLDGDVTGANETQLLADLEQVYRDSDHPEWLLMACEIRARRQEWKQIAALADTVLEKLPTTDVIRSVAHAVYRANEPGRCLAILDEGARAFPNGQLPSDLRTLRVQCSTALGFISRAVGEAEDLARTESTAANLLRLAYIYWSKGDSLGFLTTARRIATLSSETVQPEQLLWLARYVHSRDANLAKRLWMNARTHIKGDELLVSAFLLGSQLGVGEELSHLELCVMQMAREGRGHIQLATFDDARQLFEAEHEHSVQIERTYRSGMAPVHALVRGARRRLPELYHSWREELRQRRHLYRAPFLMIRYGARVPYPQRKWRIRADITAILLAADIGILEAVEEQFAPIRIPSSLIPTLRDAEVELSELQPGRRSVAEQVCAQVSRGSIQVATIGVTTGPRSAGELKLERLTALADHAARVGGLVVEFDPFIDSDGTRRRLDELGPSLRAQVVSLRSVADALRLSGPLSKGQYERVVQQLRHQAVPSADRPPPAPRTRLLFSGGTIEQLTDCGLLSVLTENFVVEIDADAHEQYKNALRGSEERSRLKCWIDSLVTHISDGIDAGKYELLQVPEKSDEPEGTRGPELDCLAEIAQPATSSDEVAWVDDRWTNSHSLVGTALPIDVTDVIEALALAGALPAERKWNSLIRLRSAGCLFLPVSAAEIMYHLRAAPIDRDGCVVETEELRVLRQYIAFCHLCADALQRGPMTGAPNQSGEASFAYAHRRAIEDALTEAWKSAETIDNAKAQGTWILENLYVDLQISAGLFRQEPAMLRESYPAGVGLAGLLSKAFSIGPLLAETSRGKFYLQWLVAAWGSARLRSHAELVPATAACLKRVFVDVLPADAEDELSSVTIASVQRFFGDLPDELQRELARDVSVAGKMRLKPARVAQYGPFKIEAKSFLRAVIDCVARGRTSTTVFDGEELVNVERVDNGPFRYCVKLSDSHGGNVTFVTDPALGILSDSMAERIEAVGSVESMLDGVSRDDRADLLSKPDPYERVATLHAMFESSYTYCLYSMRQRLVPGQSFGRQELLPQDFKSLLTYLRIDLRNRAVGLTEKSTERLLAEVGIEEATTRLGSVPIALPAPVLQGFAQLPDERQRKIVKALLRRCTSPIVMAHTIRLLRSVSSRAFQRLSEHLLSEVLSDRNKGRYAAFLVVVQWCLDETLRRYELAEWPMCWRLMFAWVHGDAIYRQLSRGSAEWIDRTFKNAGEAPPLLGIRNIVALREEVCSPANMSPEVIATAVLGYSSGCLEEAKLSHKMQERYRRFVVSEEGDIAIPLLRDCRGATDSLGSFFGGDRYSVLRRGLGEDSELAVSPSEQVVEKLEREANKSTTWCLLNPFLGGFVAAPSIRQRLIPLMNNADFVTMVKADNVQGVHALMSAAVLARTLSDETVRRKLLAETKAVAEVLSSMPQTDALEKMAALLVEAALFLTTPTANGQEEDQIWQPLTAHLEELSVRWKRVGGMARLVAQGLCRELPVGESAEWWLLNLRLRSM